MCAKASLFLFTVTKTREESVTRDYMFIYLFIIRHTKQNTINKLVGRYLSVFIKSFKLDGIPKQV